MEQEELTGRIIGCAMTVHRTLGSGFLESVYQVALVHELSASGMTVAQKHRIQVHYRGMVVGEFVADIVVNERVIVEIKAVRRLVLAHEVQLVNYLTATGVDIGILLNFGAERLEFRRKHRRYHGPAA